MDWAFELHQPLHLVFGNVLCVRPSSSLERLVFPFCGGTTIEGDLHSPVLLMDLFYFSVRCFSRPLDPFSHLNFSGSYHKTGEAPW